MLDSCFKPSSIYNIFPQRQMAVFTYSIKTNEGKVLKGNLEADSKNKALEYLHSQGSIVLSLKAARTSKLAQRAGGVKTDEVVIFTRQLTTLIESGIPIVATLDILTQQVTNPYFKTIIGTILKDLKEGTSFAASLAKHPKVFPEIYISMVEAAETSGNLPQILERLSVYLEKMSALKKKIISSMIYPLIVLVMTVSATSFLIFKIVPTFAQLYNSLGAKLPLMTQMLVVFAEFAKKNVPLLIGVVIALIVLFRKYISTPKGKRNWHQFLLRMPILGEVVRKLSIAKFARTFATLVRSSVPITSSLEIVGKTSGNKIIEEAVIKAQTSIQEGVPLSTPLEESGVFPPMVVKMIAVGEKSGKLEHMLSKIAEFYEEQTEAAIAALTSMLEPILIVMLGFIVGFIVIALFLPIINISQILLHN